MNERPIIFNSEMVRAILNGKTQTRRVIKPQPFHVRHGVHTWKERECFHLPYGIRSNFIRLCPYGQVGDRLWVRETWAAYGWLDRFKPSFMPRDETIFYKATDNGRSDRLKWRPSIHMPQWASRLTLEITEIRVERVQEITFEDCLSEGLLSLNPEVITEFGKDWQPPQANGKKPVDELADELDSEIRHLWIKYWDSINDKKHPWESNPWVWVISFNKL